MKTFELKMDHINDGPTWRIRVSGQGKTPSVCGPLDEMKEIMAHAPAGSSREVLIEYLQEQQDRRARERHDKAAAKRAASLSPSAHRAPSTNVLNALSNY